MTDKDNGHESSEDSVALSERRVPNLIQTVSMEDQADNEKLDTIEMERSRSSSILPINTNYSEMSGYVPSDNDETLGGMFLIE